jgi:hypothetical protein
MEVLEGLAESKVLPRILKQDLLWVNDLIQNRKLYIASIEIEDIENLTESVKMWLIEKSGNEDAEIFMQSQATMRDGSDKMKRKQLSALDIKMTAFSEIEAAIDEVLGIIPEEMDIIGEKMAEIDEWNWDVTAFCRETSERAFQIIGLKLFLHHDIFRQQGYEFQILSNFLGKLQEGYYESNKYHNVNHIVDCVHAMHFFIKPAGIEQYLTISDVSLAFIATFIHDYEHPGVTN